VRPVVYVAPYLLEATTRFLEAVADLPGVRLGLVTQDPLEKVPPRVRGKLAQHWRVEDALDPRQVVEAVRQVSARIGTVERLIGTLEQAQVPLAEAREALGLPGLSVAAARNFRDKSRMKDVLRAHGLPCARHRLAAGVLDARDFAREVGFPLVAKPPAGAGAKGTVRVDGPEALEEAVAAAAPTAARPVLLEEFVRGEEHSFDVVSIDGKPVWHSVSRYLPSPLHVLENPWIQWVVIVPREVDHPRYDEIRRVGFRALEALGMGTGVAHMEWFRRPDGSVCVSEVGARPPGAQFCSLISWANDVDFYAAWARVVVFDRFDPPPRRHAAGAAYLRGQGEGRVVGVEGVDEVVRELGGLVVEARLPRPGQGPSGSYEGEGYVIVRDDDTERVERALSRLVSRVRVVLG
jgi:formate-dependent phosphoribosylglycinamide formyltransferase (GAR transformylase)